MKKFVKKIFGKYGDAIWAGWTTAVATAVVGALASAVGYLNQLYEWASSSGAEPLPEVSNLGKTLVAIGLALAVGVGNTLFRAAQLWLGSGSVPEYTSTADRVDEV